MGRPAQRLADPLPPPLAPAETMSRPKAGDLEGNEVSGPGLTNGLTRYLSGDL